MQDITIFCSADHQPMSLPSPVEQRYFWQNWATLHLKTEITNNKQNITYYHINNSVSNKVINQCACFNKQMNGQMEIKS